MQSRGKKVEKEGECVDKRKREKKTYKVQISRVSEVRTQAKYRMVDVSFLERG